MIDFRYVLKRALRRWRDANGGAGNEQRDAGSADGAKAGTRVDFTPDDCEQRDAGRDPMVLDIACRKRARERELRLMGASKAHALRIIRREFPAPDH